jgi:hypothetical protein
MQVMESMSFAILVMFGQNTRRPLGRKQLPASTDLARCRHEPGGLAGWSLGTGEMNCFPVKIERHLTLCPKFSIFSLIHSSVPMSDRTLAPVIWRTGSDTSAYRDHLILVPEPPEVSAIQREIARAYGAIASRFDECFTLSRAGRAIHSGSHYTRRDPLRCTFHAPVTVRFVESERKEFSHEFYEGIYVQHIRRFLAAAQYHCETEDIALVSGGVVADDRTRISDDRASFHVYIDRHSDLSVCFRYLDPVRFPELSFEYRIGFAPRACVGDAIEKFARIWNVEARFVKIGIPALQSNVLLCDIAHTILPVQTIADSPVHISVDGESPTAKSFGAIWRFLTGYCPYRLMFRECELSPDCNGFQRLETTPLHPIVLVRQEAVTVTATGREPFQIFVDREETAACVIARLESLLCRDIARLTIVPSLGLWSRTFWNTSVEYPRVLSPHETVGNGALTVVDGPLQWVSVLLPDGRESTLKFRAPINIVHLKAHVIRNNYAHSPDANFVVLTAGALPADTDPVISDCQYYLVNARDKLKICIRLGNEQPESVEIAPTSRVEDLRILASGRIGEECDIRFRGASLGRDSFLAICVATHRQSIFYVEPRTMLIDVIVSQTQFRLRTARTDDPIDLKRALEPHFDLPASAVVSMPFRTPSFSSMSMYWPLPPVLVTRPRGVTLRLPLTDCATGVSSEVRLQLNATLTNVAALLDHETAGDYEFFESRDGHPIDGRASLNSLILNTGGLLFRWHPRADNSHERMISVSLILPPDDVTTQIWLPIDARVADALTVAISQMGDRSGVSYRAVNESEEILQEDILLSDCPGFDRQALAIYVWVRQNH